jgi:hypothetical protein
LTTLQQYKRQIFMTQCQLQFVNNSKKNGKTKQNTRTVFKAREKQATDRSNESFWSFYLMLHVFLKFKQPTTVRINFDLTKI